MRLVTSSALTLVLTLACIGSFAPAARAQTLDSSISYGSTFCTTPAPCSMTEINVDALVTQTSHCLSRRFALTNEALFDPGYGLDENNCLKTIGSQKFGTSNIPIAPQCCFVRTESISGDTCQLKCELFPAK